jgi:cytoskeletal protein RodZ
MESLGEKLKEARTSKGISLDQIAQETYISKSFVVALEEEDFSVFPGETYLIGFLRNYADYLGLDSESLITLYKNIKIQEQPLPMDELIHGKRNFPSNYILILSIIGVLVLGGVISLFVIVGSQNGTANAEEELVKKQMVFDANNKKAGKEFLLKEIALTDEFKTGDLIKIPFGEDKLFKIEVGTIEKDLVTFLLPEDKKIQVQVNKAEVLSLHTNSDSKLRIILNKILALGALDKRINLSLTKLGAQMSPLDQVANFAQTDPVTQPVNPFSVNNGQVQGLTLPAPTTTLNRSPVTSPTQVPPTSTTQREVAEQVITSITGQPQLFTVRAEFNNNCFLRYLIDGKTSKEQLFQKNQNLLIDTAYQSLKIWASNAGAVRLKVEGQEISLGRQGQVITKVIKWVREGETNTYKLMISSVP